MCSSGHLPDTCVGSSCFCILCTTFALWSGDGFCSYRAQTLDRNNKDFGFRGDNVLSPSFDGDVCRIGLSGLDMATCKKMRSILLTLREIRSMQINVIEGTS